MLIPCPHCGPRDVGEFTYGGDATRPRPAADAPREEWCAYLFERENPMGSHREYWQHTGGCRAVLIAVRDVRTHEVHGTELCGPHGTGRPGPLPGRHSHPQPHPQTRPQHREPAPATAGDAVDAPSLEPAE